MPVQNGLATTLLKPNYILVVACPSPQNFANLPGVINQGFSIKAGGGLGQACMLIQDGTAILIASLSPRKHRPLKSRNNTQTQPRNPDRA